MKNKKYHIFPFLSMAAVVLLGTVDSRAQGNGETAIVDVDIVAKELGISRHSRTS